jgi:predicted outer membrane protein
MAAIALVLLAGCSKNSDNTLIVKVNDARITVGDIKKQVAGLPPETLQLIATDEKARKSVLDDIIAFELALQEARRQGLANIEFNQRQAAMRKEMDRRIQEEGRNELVTSLLRKELADKLNAKPTDAEVKEFYAKYKDKMVTPDGRKVSLQEAAPDIRDRLVSMKQRDASYTPGSFAKRPRSPSTRSLSRSWHRPSRKLPIRADSLPSFRRRRMTHTRERDRPLNNC